VVEEAGIGIEPLVVVDALVVQGQRQADGPVRGPDGDVHRACPVDAQADGIGLHEIGDLVEDLAGKARLAADPPSLAES
jgi:hypothetical protein